MGQPGRKRLSGPREPSGRPQRPTTEVARQAEIVSIAARQPHRRDAVRPLDPWGVSAVGRLVRDGVIAPSGGVTCNDLMAAARQLETLYRAVSARISAPRPLAVTDGGSGADMDADKARAAQANWEAMGRYLRLRPYGDRIEALTYALVLDHHADDWVCPYQISFYGGMGVRLLVDWFPKT
jgi:hypothetical protein